MAANTGAVALVGAMLSANLLAQAPPGAEELARRIQARQQTIQDFTASFEQVVSSPLLPTSAERGDLKVKRPGRFSLVYATGDKNEYWGDGTTLRVYHKRDRFGTQSALPDDNEAPTWMSFLAGRGDLVRDFSARFAENQPAGEWHLVLTPRRSPASFASLELQVDRQTLQLRGLVVVDAQGTTNRYRFSNLRENVGLTDRAFQFQFPKGVDVQAR
jgi:chaperone LolA